MSPRRLRSRYEGNIMPDHDRLSSLILNHWSRYHPSMLAQLKQQNRLQEELEKTAEQFTDLLYELVSVRKMEYHQAWEMAVNEFLLPEESSLTNPKTSPPAISELQMTTGSGWAARMKKRARTPKPSGS
jgi:hypothetical protein